MIQTHWFTLLPTGWVWHHSQHLILNSNNNNTKINDSQVLVRPWLTLFRVATRQVQVVPWNFFRSYQYYITSADWLITTATATITITTVLIDTIIISRRTTWTRRNTSRITTTTTTINGIWVKKCTDCTFPSLISTDHGWEGRNDPSDGKSLILKCICFPWGLSITPKIASDERVRMVCHYSLTELSFIHSLGFSDLPT